MWSNQPLDDAPFDEDSPAPQPPLPSLQGEVSLVSPPSKSFLKPVRCPPPKMWACEAVDRAQHRLHHTRLRLGHLYCGDSELWQGLASLLHSRSAPIIGGGAPLRCCCCCCYCAI